MSEPITTFARLEEDVRLTEMRSLPVPEWDALMAEVATLRARLAYIGSYGGAWEQRVVRGELDDAALGREGVVGS
jgi:hypothetical protein